MIMRFYKFLVLLILYTPFATAQVALDSKGTLIPVDSSEWQLNGDNLYNKNSENVGIGTDNPSAKLTIDVNGSNSVPVLKLKHPQSGSTSDSILTWSSNDSSVRRIYARSLDSNVYKNDGQLNSNRTIDLNGNTLTIQTGGQNFIFSGLSNGSPSDSILSWEPSTGKVRMINNTNESPAIYTEAYKTNNYNVSAFFTTLTFNTTSINQNSSYNPSTGIFTAPSSGLYQVVFCGTFSGQSFSNSVACRVVKNGSNIEIQSYASIVGVFSQTIGSININKNIYLAAGDNIRIQVGDEIGTIQPYLGTNRNILQITKL